LVSLVLLAFATGCANHRRLEGGSGEVEVGGGLRARWSYHFNRNSIRDALISGKSLVALTESGDLLRFDVDTMALTAERVGQRSVVCLGSGLDGAILAADDNGTISKLDSGTLEPIPLARIDERIAWIGVDAVSGGLLAVSSPTEEDLGKHFGSDQVVCRVHDISTGKLYRPRKKMVMSWSMARAIFLDSNRRLWIGFDWGEWGGGAVFVDLAIGTMGEVEEAWAADNVFGFFEPSPGEVWAYGGLIHFSANWFIARVDRGKAEMVAMSRDARGNAVEHQPGTPELPITSIFSGGTEDSLIVLSFHELFRFHPKDKRWEFLHRFRPRYVAGRPDAMGSYPAIRKVLRPKSDALKVILATRRDGLISYSGETENRHTIPNQPEMVDLEKIQSDDKGLLFIGEGCWALRDGQWLKETLRPPVKPWGSSCFATPDGTLWSADDQGLSRFESKDWVRCNQENPTPSRPRVVSSGGPPWILHCNSDRHQLFRLAIGPGPNEARIERLLENEKDRVRDILELEPGHFLLATDGGLKSWQGGAETFAPPAVPLPPRKVWTLARDGSGRIWMGGEGLCLFHAGKLIVLEEVPRAASMRVWVLAADPDDPYGIIASSDGDPLLFVSVSASVR